MTKDTDLKNIEFEDVECLICKTASHRVKLFSARDLLTGLPGSFSICRCEKCGLVFQSPRPKERYIHLFYPDDLGYFTAQSKGMPLLEKIEQTVLTNYYGYPGKKSIFDKIATYAFYAYIYKSRSIPNYRKNGALLEIGCSNGTKLESLKKLGWKTTGIELNKKAAKTAIEKGLDVWIGSIHDFDFPKESFDVIILDMVLEHLYAPDKALEKLTGWLKKDGQLIFSIPYFDGVEFRIFKEYSYGLQLPTHITFFNKRAIQHLLQQNFSAISYAFHHFDRDIIASAQYKYDATGSALHRFISRNKFFRTLIIRPVLFILSMLGKTSLVTVFARKRSD